MIPMLEKIDEMGIKYSNIVDDAGYDSEENTAWLEKRGFKCYIKPQNYAKKQKRSFKKKIGERENMAYSAELDEYTCANGRALKAVRTGERTSHSGYKSMIAYYQCESCENCGFKGKGAGKRSNAKGDSAMGVSKEQARLRRISEASAASSMGIVFRINRSIQAEGAFSAMRVWLGLERLSMWGSQGARAQAALFALAFNVRKFHSKVQNNRLGKKLRQKTV
jgi:hypothetical protein